MGMTMIARLFVYLLTSSVLAHFSIALAQAKDLKPDRSGMASVYSYKGGRTASGEQVRPGELTAAHRSLPFGTMVRVTNRRNGRQVVVRINDRGPFIRGRIIDITPAAARTLGFSGLAPVTVEVVRG